MDRATKAIKRGSIRLKSYSEINLILSDLNDIRSASKTSVQAHQTFVEDLRRWANQESNESVKNSFSFLTELNVLWTEIHNELFESLKKSKQQFELILESEHAIDKARNNSLNCEQTEMKLNKELKKSVERFGSLSGESRKLEDKLRDAKRASEIAKVEVAQKEDENKIIKLIRIKEGLKKLTDSYAQLSQKSTMIMQAQKVIVNQLPDDTQVNQDIQFTNECKIKQAVAKAKALIQAINCTSSPRDINFPEEYDAPPPYSPDFGPSTSIHNRSNLPSSSSDSNWYPHLNSTRTLVDRSGCNDQPRTYICCKCSAQMISDHRYLPTEEADTELTGRLRNTRISGRSGHRGRRTRR